jgi:NTP pyrophosphatase (non-canonical NTP hydrolase)
MKKEDLDVFESDAIEAIDYLVDRSHETAKEKGFWDEPRNDGEAIALMHSELSEALEGIRHGDPPSDHIPEFSASEEELADLLIRVFDFAGGRKIRLGAAVISKMKFNDGREYRHGKKF